MVKILGVQASTLKLSNLAQKQEICHFTLSQPLYVSDVVAVGFCYNLCCTSKPFEFRQVVCYTTQQKRRKKNIHYILKEQYARHE